MQIQTLSCVVPTQGCVNKCKFCVSKTHPNRYTNQIEDNQRFFDLYQHDYINRLQFARDNGCNTLILTGNGEPLQNKQFLKFFSHWNKMLPNPYQWIELQTTGVFIDDEMLRFMRNTVGVTTISLSVSDVFSDENNVAIIGMPQAIRFPLMGLCQEIKKYDFNLRLSLNLTDTYNNIVPTKIFDRVKELGTDQVIFRKLYLSGGKTAQDQWIQEHSMDDMQMKQLDIYISMQGKPLEILPFGATRYSLHGLSTVFDYDCMSMEVKETFRYLILQPNCKLYSKWDDPASLIF